MEAVNCEICGIPNAICGGPHHETFTDLGWEVLKQEQEPMGKPIAPTPEDEKTRYSRLRADAVARSSGHLGRAFGRTRPAPGSEANAANKRGIFPVPLRPLDPADGPAEGTYIAGQDPTDYPTESDVLGWGSRSDLSARRQNLRLKAAIKFIAEKGLAGEFATWMRSNK